MRSRHILMEPDTMDVKATTVKGEKEELTGDELWDAWLKENLSVEDYNKLLVIRPRKES
jgi:hypothetical protein